jgi:peptide/nickel transport system substrate-binding protein
MVETLVAGAGVVASHPFSPLAEEWTFGSLSPFPAPAGKPPAFTSPLVILLDSGMMNRWPHGDIAQVMHAQFNAWGVRSVIAVKETGAYYEDLKQGRFHLSLQPNALMTGDPDFFYSYFVASDGAAYCRCGSGEMNDLIVQGRHAMNPERRKAIYRRLATLFADELPLLPLYHDLSYYAFGPRVVSFSMDHYFRPLLLEARPPDRP